jgi:hypothetical protein
MESRLHERTNSERSMAKGKMLSAVLLVAIAALLGPEPALAQQTAGDAQAGSEMNARATNRAMLAALQKRRDQVARSTNNRQGRRAALQFLDSQIAKVRNDLGE